MYRCLGIAAGVIVSLFAGAGRALAPVEAAGVVSNGSVAPGLRTSADGQVRLTGALPNLNLRQAAERLATLIGFEVVLPEPDELSAEEPESRSTEPTGSRRQPELDLERRVSLTWNDTPLGEALRQFCRGYGCRLDWSGQPGGSVFLIPGNLPRGPVAHVPGYTLEVAAIHFHDERTVEETEVAPEVERGLELQLIARADTGDPTPIYGFHNVRIVDDLNRDSLETEEEPDGFGLAGGAAASPFPDERVRTVTFAWPYPAPHRLRLIEGDLLLFSRIRRMPFDLRLPRSGESGEIRRMGPFQVEFQQLTYENGHVALGLNIHTPPGLTFQLAGQLPRVTLVLDDGSRVPAYLSRSDSGEVGDGSHWRYETLELERADLKARPVRLLMDLQVKSEPDRKLHFRFSDFPAVITPRGPGS